jgi:hypothetical protein
MIRCQTCWNFEDYCSCPANDPGKIARQIDREWAKINECDLESWVSPPSYRSFFDRWFNRNLWGDAE